MTLTPGARSRLIQLAPLILLSPPAVSMADDVYIDVDTIWTQSGSEWIYLGTLGTSPTLTLGSGGSAFAVESYEGAHIVVDGGHADQASFTGTTGDFAILDGSVGDVYFNGGSHSVSLRGGSVASLHAWQGGSGSTVLVSGGSHGMIDTYDMVGRATMTAGQVATWANSLAMTGGDVGAYSFSQGASILDLQGGHIDVASLTYGRAFVRSGDISSLTLNESASVELFAESFEYTTDGIIWTPISSGIYGDGSVLDGALGLRASDQSWLIGNISVLDLAFDPFDNLTVADDGENWQGSYLVLSSLPVPGPVGPATLAAVTLVRRRRRRRPRPDYARTPGPLELHQAVESSEANSWPDTSARQYARRSRFAANGASILACLATLMISRVAASDVATFTANGSVDCNGQLRDDQFSTVSQFDAGFDFAWDGTFDFDQSSGTSATLQGTSLSTSPRIGLGTAISGNTVTLTYVDAVSSQITAGDGSGHSVDFYHLTDTTINVTTTQWTRMALVNYNAYFQMPLSGSNGATAYVLDVSGPTPSPDGTGPLPTGGTVDALNIISTPNYELLLSPGTWSFRMNGGIAGPTYFDAITGLEFEQSISLAFTTYPIPGPAGLPLLLAALLPRTRRR